MKLEFRFDVSLSRFILVYVVYLLISAFKKFLLNNKDDKKTETEDKETLLENDSKIQVLLLRDQN